MLNRDSLRTTCIESLMATQNTPLVARSKYPTPDDSRAIKYLHLFRDPSLFLFHPETFCLASDFCPLGLEHCFLPTVASEPGKSGMEGMPLRKDLRYDAPESTISFQPLCHHAPLFGGTGPSCAASKRFPGTIQAYSFLILKPCVCFPST